MNRFPRTVFLVFLLALAATLSVAAQTAGCCCNLANASAQADSYLPQSNCLPAYPDFVTPTSTDIVLNKSCSTKCGEVANIPNITTGACGSATFKPPPGNFTVNPVKGQRAMRLTWSAVCPADAYVISKCTGAGCTNFQQIAIIGPSTSFTDGSPDLHWNTNYSYRATAKYSIQGDSLPATDTDATGDLECEAQFSTDSFCISSYTYISFKSYLQAFGYDGTPKTGASQFASASFDTTVNATFFFKFNKAVTCDAQNRLSILQSCGAGTLCVAQGLTPQCITPGPCDPQNGLFGLGASVGECEGTAGSQKYCFLDRSSTSVDSCYACSQALACYDYKSKGACQRNNCGAGACSWFDTYPDVGAGVCIDTRYNNCALCNKTGTIGAPNSNSYNLVFDQCSPQKATALSTTQYPCFFSGGQAVDCTGVTCKDYSAGQCGSPAGGITLNPDNSIATPSTDPCNVAVCQLDSLNPNIGCRKNADATPASTFWPDCGLNDTLCERDHYPPLTTLIPIGGAGKFDFLNVRIWDRSNSTEFGHLIQPQGGFSLSIGQSNSTGSRQELSNWTTYFCAATQGGAPCSNFVGVNSTQLNLNNQLLQDGTKVLLNMSVGWNTLRYYSQDPSKNLEIIKNFSVYACDACQGPKMLTFNLTPSRNVGGTYYTNSLAPVARLGFNTPADLVFSGFVQGSASTQLDRAPASGFSLNYVSTLPSGQQLSEGAYTFSANARDSDNLFMDAPVSLPIVVDTTPPTATYAPAAGAVLTTGTVQIKINFSEPVVVQNFTLIEYLVYNTTVGPVRRPVVRDYTSQFVASNNNRTFTATLILSEGRKIIVPIVTDLAGNALSSSTNSSEFVINGGPPVVTLKQPPYGVSSTFTFDLGFETDSVTECRYWDSQTLPPPSLFGALQQFDSTNNFDHLKFGFNKITKQNTPYKFYVQCVDPQTGTGSNTFWLSVDQSSPKILSAFASPNPIVQLPLQTTLKVQTDDLTVCKYSTTTTNFDAMDSEFPWFSVFGLTVHAVNVTVPSPATYTYHVACKNVAGLGPVSKDILFGVDLSQDLTIESTTPDYWGNLSVPIGIITNKDTFCYYLLDGNLIAFGPSNVSSMSHSVIIPVPGPGEWDIPVYCNTGEGTSEQGIEETNITIHVFVDLTPPTMTYVNDTSNNPAFPEISYFLDRLRVAMLGQDLESNVSRYFYTVQEKNTNAVVRNWTPSVTLNGLPWYIPSLNLSNGVSYYIRAKAENRAALLSNDLASDGVTIDITKIPPQCVNQLLDPNETDIDCGGICPPCADFKNCTVSIDCQSRICNSTEICQPSLCTDLVNGGNETDIDCGGNICTHCDNNRTCAINDDCKSNYCASGVCNNNPCKNGHLDGQESDVDCGGACADKCGPGQTCVVETDCVLGTACVDHLCASVGDEDQDGIPDNVDKCPGTPPGEPVDQDGCSASQRYSCGDEIPDSWRIRYFGDVVCEGDAAATADPDGDGYTNLQEWQNGTDPTTSDRFFLFTWPWLLLLFLLLSGFIVGFWYYRKHKDAVNKRLQHLRQRFLPRQAPVPTKAPEKPAPPKEAPHIEDWLSLKDLKKLGPEDMSATTFNKLDAFIKGELAEKEHAGLLKRLEKEATPLDRLRAMALAGLSAKERKDLLMKLRLLRRGKLTKEQIEELFRKLRITAAYYDTHKQELEEELARFVRGEKRKRRR
jgi:hypothetical protein